jgi:plastocyanin
MRESYSRDSDPGTTALRRVPAWVLVMAVPVVAVIAVFITNELSENGGATAQSTTSPDTVNIKNFSFSPNPISVRAGAPITVVNDDNVTHTFTANGGAFDTGDLGGDHRDRVTVQRPGTYAFHCEIHTFMTGTVRVSQ